MIILKTVHETQKYIADLKKQGKTIGFVPTLGHLHKGHQALMEQARKENDVLIISIFVNPLQFRKKQYHDYPTDLDRDKQIAKHTNVDAIFAPSVEEMYPFAKSLDDLFDLQDYDHTKRKKSEFTINEKKSFLDTIIRVPSNLTDKMDGINFPWHFDGVVSVVYRLFKIIQPHRSYFGEKDTQQLVILINLGKRFFPEIQIQNVPTLRQENGLVFSSRNSLLTQSQTESVLIIYTALKTARDIIINGEKNRDTILKKITDLIKSKPDIEIDYLDIINLNTLEKITAISETVVIYCAILINGIRLTDNLIVKV